MPFESHFVLLFSHMRELNFQHLKANLKNVRVKCVGQIACVRYGLNLNTSLHCLLDTW